MNEHQRSQSGLSLDEFVSVMEAARLLHVSEVTVRRWIAQGRIRSYRLGAKKLRLRHSELALLVSSVEALPVGRMVNSLLLLPMSGSRARGVDIVAEARARLETQRSRRGYQPVIEAWEDINAARDERFDQL